MIVANISRDIQVSRDFLAQSEMYAEVVYSCKKLLAYSDIAAGVREYIAPRISQYNINKFDVGYFPDDEHLDVLISEVGEKTLSDLRLMGTWFAQDRSHIISKRKGYFGHHNIIFPYKDEYGNILALTGRTMLSDREQVELEIPKYKNTIFNKSLYLFGLYQAKKAIHKRGGVILVEGQIDCISCHGSGFQNTVALGGTNLSRYHFHRLKKATDNLYLLLDNDSAGKKAEKLSHHHLRP